MSFSVTAGISHGRYHPPSNRRGLKTSTLQPLLHWLISLGDYQADNVSAVSSGFSNLQPPWLDCGLFESRSPCKFPFASPSPHWIELYWRMLARVHELQERVNCGTSTGDFKSITKRSKAERPGTPHHRPGKTTCFFNWIRHVCAQWLSPVRLWDPRVCRTPGFSVHGISQGRILE